MNANTYVKSLVLGTTLGIITLTGCNNRRLEYSDVKTEYAVVREKHHRNSYMYPVHIGKITTLQTVPALNSISLDGVIDFSFNDKKLYDKFNKNDSVNVQYREVYRSIYADKNKDNIPELISKKFLRYECLGVFAKNNTNNN